MKNALSVTKRNSGRAVILDLSGEINLSTSPTLRDHLLKELNQSAGAVLLNLGEVPYVDSSGLATMIEGMQVAIRKKNKLVLYNLSERVLGVFEVSKLTRAFSIERDEAAALQFAGD